MKSVATFIILFFGVTSLLSASQEVFFFCGGRALKDMYVVNGENRFTLNVLRNNFTSVISTGPQFDFYRSEEAFLQEEEPFATLTVNPALTKALVGVTLFKKRMITHVVPVSESSDPEEEFVVFVNFTEGHIAMMFDDEKVLLSEYGDSQKVPMKERLEMKSSGMKIGFQQGGENERWRVLRRTPDVYYHRTNTYTIIALVRDEVYDSVSDETVVLYRFASHTFTKNSW